MYTQEIDKNFLLLELDKERASSRPMQRSCAFVT
jgi:hypothetical protein